MIKLRAFNHKMHLDGGLRRLHNLFEENAVLALSNQIMNCEFYSLRLHFRLGKHISMQ